MITMNSDRDTAQPCASLLLDRKASVAVVKAFILEP